MKKKTEPTIFSSGNYLLSYNKERNYIFIDLPQTEVTVNNTVEEIERRKVDVTAVELLLILNLVKLIFRKEGEQCESG